MNYHHCVVKTWGNFFLSLKTHQPMEFEQKTGCKRLIYYYHYHFFSYLAANLEIRSDTL